MSIRNIALMTVGFLLALSLQARAQEEIIPDERLKRKITYSASAAKLEDVAAELMKKSGVPISVGSGPRDWKDRERRIHVHFQEVPLGLALQGISKTLGYELRRAGDEGKWSYRIYQSPRNRDYEAAMLSAQKEERERQVVSMRESVLSDAEEALNMTPEEAAKLKEKDPWKAYLGGTESGRAYAEMLRGLSPEARELMLRGRRVTLNAGELPPELKRAMWQMVNNSFFQHMGQEQGQLGEALKNASPARIAFMPLDQEMLMGPLPASSMGMAGFVVVLGDYNGSSPDAQRLMDQFENSGMGQGVPMAGMPLAGSGSMAGNMFARMMDRLESGEKMNTVMQDMQQQMQNPGALADQPGNEITPSPTPTDPALLVEVEPIQLKYDVMSQESQSAELIRELGKRTKLSYVVEYHPESTPLAMAMPSKKMPLYKLLDSLQRAGLQWTYENGAVRIQPKDWAVQRSYDVPDSLMAGYKQILETKGWLDLDSLSSLAASLTDGQLQHRVLRDPAFSPYMMSLMPMNNNRDLLRFYGELAPPQRARLQAEGGLPFDQLSEAQWQRLAYFIEDAAPGAEIRPGRVTLTLKEDAFPTPPSPRGGNEPPAGDSPPPAASANAPANPPASPSAETVNPPPAPAAANKPEEPTGHPPANAEERPEGPQMMSGPMFMLAEFTVEMVGDQPDKPYTLRRRVQIPTKSFIENMRSQRERMHKQQEEMRKKREATKEAKPSEMPPAPRR